MDIIVLEYSTGTVYIYRNINTDIEDNVFLFEEWLCNQGHHIEDCYYMTSKKLKFKIN